MRLGAALGDELQERTGPAPDVEDARAGLEAGSFECGRVGRQLPVLAQRPVGRARSPERPPSATRSPFLRMLSTQPLLPLAYVS